MSVSKLSKFVEKPIIIQNTHINKKPVLLSSSKGFCLKPHHDLIEQFGHSIEFCCKPGGTFDFGLHYLEKNLDRLVVQYKSIVLYIWLGTCDITTKRGKFIYLTHKTDDECSDFISFKLNQFVKLCSRFTPHVKLIFLEIPPYSLKDWNLFKGCSLSHIVDLDEQEQVLHRRIDILNELVKSTNNRLNPLGDVLSLNFRSDLLIYKRAGKAPVVNYKLLRGGVNPIDLLARSWMKRLVSKIFIDCQ